jgi:hypothetical protein
MPIPEQDFSDMQVWGSANIARLCGLGKRTWQIRHRDAMASIGVIFKRKRSPGCYVYWGYIQEIKRYLAAYQTKHGHL